MYWTAPRIWPNETVYIIGGGSSLKDVDLEPLHQRNVIGCNDAYMLGSWIDVCCFGDIKWFGEHKERLKDFLGLKVTWREEYLQESGIHVMKGEPRGLILKPGWIGWNTNTGAMAINLAVVFGAKKIVLLGFDMKLDKDGENNWHKNNVDKPDKDVFKKFLKSFLYLQLDMKKKVPDVEVLNATPDSRLKAFPKVDLKEVLSVDI